MIISRLSANMEVDIMGALAVWWNKKADLVHLLDRIIDEPDMCNPSWNMLHLGLFPFDYNPRIDGGYSLIMQ